MRGDEGVGKGVFGHALVKIFGVHGMHVSQPEQLVGKFNAHQMNLCLLFCDEAFFAGDPRHIRVLKALITEGLVTIEKKFVDPLQMPNRLGILMASNADFVVPAGKDARRFCCLDVADTSEGDPAYFKRLADAIKDPVQLGAFLQFLLARDLSDFDVRKFPKTEMLGDQKAASLDHHETWLLRLLHIGHVQEHDVVVHYAPHNNTSIDHIWTWSEWYSTRALFANYEVHAQTCAYRHPLNPVTFGKFMTAHFRAGKKSDIPGYHFGQLDQARAAFAEQHGLSGDVWGLEQPDLPLDEPPASPKSRAQRGAANGSDGARKAAPPCDQPGCKHPACATGPTGNWCGDHLKP